MPRDNKQNLPIIPRSPLLFGGKSLFPPSSTFFLRLLFVQVTAAQRISLQCALHSVQKQETIKDWHVPRLRDLHLWKVLNATLCPPLAPSLCYQLFANAPRIRIDPHSQRGESPAMQKMRDLFLPLCDVHAGIAIWRGEGVGKQCQNPRVAALAAFRIAMETWH